eukprot:c20651_g1_i2.p1 GENE.c20651_g1_i2~~c20651_g1_i2.p1  ORF type:complete len:717 (+),score=153.90 c20651_g1_i2:845-2995(+)
MTTFWVSPQLLGRNAREVMFLDRVSNFAPMYPRSRSVSLDPADPTKTRQVHYLHTVALVKTLRNEFKSDIRLTVLDVATVVISLTDMSDLDMYEKAEDARKHAVSRLEAESRFFANMNHELRTPLNVVVGTADLMRDRGSSLTELELREFLDTITFSSESLLRLINDILLLSSITSKDPRLTFNICATNLTDLLHETMRSLSLLASKKHISLALCVPHNMPAFLTDPSRLQQLIVNLVNNAIKYSQGGIKENKQVDSVVVRCEIMSGATRRRKLATELAGAHDGTAHSTAGSEPEWTSDESFADKAGSSQGDNDTGSKKHRKVGSTSIGSSDRLKVTGKAQTNPIATRAHSHLNDHGIKDVGKAAEWLEIRVQDTGTGIAEKRLKSIFDRFLREDTQFVREQEGCGLGLAICVEIVKSLKGSIHVMSKRGVGSTFVAYLPFAAVQSDPRPATPTRNLNQVGLVVIDGCDNTRSAMSECLEAAGMASTACCDLDAGLAAVRSWSRPTPLTHVLVDTQTVSVVPEMLGALRRECARRGIKVARLDALDRLTTSEKGKGPGFDLEVSKPLRLSQLITREPITPTTHHIEQQETSPTARPLVLVVEDHSMNRKIACKMLETIGCDTLQAENGLIAVTMALAERTKPIDLILMDINMAVLDGLQATAQIRAQGNQVPIVACTAHLIEEVRERCLDAGMNHVSQKPLRIADLKTVISSFLRS